MTKALALFVLLLASNATGAWAESLRMLNWEEYLNPEVIELWRKETGVDIEQIYFDNDEERDEILARAGNHAIDLAVVDEAASEFFGAYVKIEPIEQSKVPNLQHIDPFWQSTCGNYSVPYMWGTLGIAYRTDVISQPPDSWLVLLQPDDALKGHIGMLGDYRDMLAPALFVLGYDLNTDDTEELKQAFAYLKHQAPSVLTYEYGITFLKSSKDADEMHMAMVYGGDQHIINELIGKPGLWQYIVPREGTILWADCLAVISDSPRKQLSLKFIDFLNRPEIAAMNAEYLATGTPNLSAIAHMSQTFQSDRSVFPPKPIMDRSQQYQTLTKDNIILRKRITSAVRKVHESR